MSLIKSLFINDNAVKELISGLLVDQRSLDVLWQMPAYCQSYREANCLTSRPYVNFIDQVIRTYSVTYGTALSPSYQPVNDFLKTHSTRIQNEYQVLHAHGISPTDIYLIDCADIMYHYPISDNGFLNNTRITSDGFDDVHRFTSELYDEDTANELFTDIVGGLDQLLTRVDQTLISIVHPETVKTVDVFLTAITSVPHRGIMLHVVA